MAEEKKSTWHISKILMFAFVFVILPAGSFWYLGIGLDRYKDRLSELDSLGTVPSFYYENQLSDTLSLANMTEKFTILGYFSSDCGAPCDSLTKVYEKIQSVFPDGYLVQMYSYATDSIDASKINNTKTNCNWHWLKGDAASLDKFFKDDLNMPIIDHYSNQLALVDSSRVIRRYYDVTDPIEIDRLITHVAMFSPRPPKRAIKFRREEEK